MRVRMKNYIGVATAEIDIDGGIVLVAGDNAQGKSSVLRGIASLVTGEIAPKGLGSSAQLVMDGRKAAELLLSAGDTTASISYPNPKFVAQGDPPHASAFAAGTMAFTDLREDERSRFLTGLLRATPSAIQVRDALKGELGEDEIVTIIKMLEAHSWDETVEKLKERRVKLKGKWEDLVGERWGDVKAKEWLPQGWEEGDAEPPPDLQARVVAAQEALDAVSRASVMSEVEYQTLHDLLGKREPTQMALNVAKTQLPTIEAEWAKLRQELDSLPAIVEEGLRCPHCGAHVVVRINPVELLPLEPLTEGEPERRKRALVKKREEVAEAYRKLEQQQGLIGACVEKLREIEKAETKLKGVAKGNGEDHDSKVGKAKEALQRAQASAARAQLAQSALEVAERVRFHSLVIDILGPDGLRRQEMEKRLAAFEAELLALTQDLPTWKPVTIDRTTLMPRYGGRPYVLCSKSEQWRLNVTLQIEIAMLEGAAIVCIDGADILSKKSQDDLFAGLLNKLAMPVIVGSTYDRPRDAPDLGKAEIGSVYWISDGVLGPLHEGAVPRH